MGLSIFTANRRGWEASILNKFYLPLPLLPLPLQLPQPLHAATVLEGIRLFYNWWKKHKYIFTWFNLSKCKKKKLYIDGLIENFMMHWQPIPTYISTLSTLTPHGSVASSNVCSITWLIVSLSDKISAKCFVPNTFRNVVAASKWVEWLKSLDWIFSEIKLVSCCQILL